MVSNDTTTWTVAVRRPRSRPNPVINLSLQQRTDLLTRFFINLPAQERAHPFRIWFHIEQAWHYYADHLLHGTKEEGFYDACAIESLTPIVVAFAIALFQIDTESWNIVKAKKQFTLLKDGYMDYQRSYKKLIPTAGCAPWIRREEKGKETLIYLLLIQDKFSGKWGCPKGKRNYEESAEDCALREFEEETGVNPTALGLTPQSLLDSEKTMIFTPTKDKQFFATQIIRPWPSITALTWKTKCPQEIKDVKWHPLRYSGKEKRWVFCEKDLICTRVTYSMLTALRDIWKH